MQDRYAGDVGDLMKLALLRALPRTVRLGVNWYKCADESHNGDGKHNNFRLKPPYRKADAQLCDLLAEATAQTRSIAMLEQSGLLPDDTLFWNHPLNYDGLTSKDERRSVRQDWFNRSLNHLKDAELVFLDPDNGYQVTSTHPHDEKGNKFATLDEVGMHLKRGQSVLLYQHMDRSAGKQVQAQTRLNFLQKHLKLASQPFAVIASPGTVRYFIFLSTDAQMAYTAANTWHKLTTTRWPWAMQMIA